MKNHGGVKKMRERNGSVGSNQTGEASAIFRAPRIRKCHVNLSGVCLTGILFSPVCTRSLYNFGDFMSVVRNSSRRDSTCRNKILFTREKQRHDSETLASVEIDIYDLPSVSSRSYFHLCLCSMRLRYRLEIFGASTIDRKFDLRIKGVNYFSYVNITYLWCYEIACREFANIFYSTEKHVIYF